MNPWCSRRFTSSASLVCSGWLLALALNFATDPKAQALTIVPTYHSSIVNHAQANTIKKTIRLAIAEYESTIVSPVTVKIIFLSDDTIELGESNTLQQKAISYADYRGKLSSGLNLPAGPSNPVNGSVNVLLVNPLYRALGLLPVRLPPDVDGQIRLNLSACNLDPTGGNDINTYSLFSTVCHELTECLGYKSALGHLNNGDPSPTGAIFPADLFRYDQNGNRSFTTDINAEAYFSVDGTVSGRLARLNQTGGADFSDFHSPGGQQPQPQDSGGTLGAQVSNAIEWKILRTIGYTIRASPGESEDPQWLDITGLGSGNENAYPGTVYRPWTTIEDALFYVGVGAAVIIKGPVDYSHGKLRIEDPCKITAALGTVRIH